MRFFADLGARIEQRWRDENYNEDVFPAIAAQALAEINPCRNLHAWDIIQWLFNATQIPSQQDLPGRFGDPPITLYAGPRFQIDVYYWLDGTTSIHQHAFCGAFQVFAGSSIHSSYNFDCRRQINEHFLIGEMNLERVELLEQGAIRRILPGKPYLHSLFHLDRPSATVCVRTYHTASGAPQFNYRKPFFAVDPFFEEALSTKLVQSTSLLLRARHPDAIAMISDLLSRSDFQTAFNILELAQSYLGNRELENAFGLTIGETQYKQLLGAARERHGSLVDLTLAVFDEAARQHYLIHRRSQITRNEHRFFLALLLNVSDRPRVLEIVHQRFPELDPIDTVLGWMEELSATKVWRATEANVLGIENLDDDYLFALQCLFKGFPRDRMAGAFADEFPADYVENMGIKPEELFDSIRSSMLFKSIFSEKPSTEIGKNLSATLT